MVPRGRPSYRQRIELTLPAKPHRNGGLVAEPDRDEKIRALAIEASQALNADLILFNSDIEPGVDYSLIELVVGRKKRKPTAYLILVTEGGSADAGFRIARCLQSCYGHFLGVVPGWCKSAGTLMCIGAYGLHIGDLGELGPLDVQLAKPDELALIASGLTIGSAFRGLQSITFQMFESFLLDLIQKSGGRITTKTAAELAANLTVGLMEPVFAQVEPMKVGEDYRFIKVAEEYALRLNAKPQNLRDSTAESGSIETLVRGYPSHEFVIDRTKSKSLFRRVAPITGPLAALVEAIGRDAVFPLSSKRLEQTKVAYLNPEEAAHDQPQQSQAPGSDKSSSGTKRASPPGPKSADPVPQNPTEGGGKLSVPVTNGPAKAARND